MAKKTTHKRKLDALWEAVTFAEVGELETARRLASEIFPDEAARRAEKILAVGGGAGFSERMVDNALGIAERLHYGVVALSVAPALAKLLAKLGRRPRERRVSVPPDVFHQRATARGIPFVYAVRRGDPEKAVADVSRTFHRIAFLVVERELTPRARFAGVDVPIFYLADP